MSSNTVLHRAETAMRRMGLMLSDFSPQERFAAILAYGADVSLSALDSYLAMPSYWDAKEVLPQKRQELLQLRADAVSAYEAGNIDLAVMTARLMDCKARLIGTLVAADPLMQTRRYIPERNARLAATPDELTRLQNIWDSYWSHHSVKGTANNAHERMAAAELDVPFNRKDKAHKALRDRIRRITEKHPNKFRLPQALRES